jgi:stress response protein SCP2
MTNSIDAIIFRRKSKIVFSAESTENVAPIGMVGAIIANVADLGYVFDEKFIGEMKLASSSTLKSLYDFVVSIIKEQNGIVYHRPMYRNFPVQVATASEEELYINAICHYLNPSFIPNYNTSYRFPFTDITEAKWIGLGVMEDIVDCFKTILESKASPSVQDVSDIETFVEFGFSCNAIFTNKERMATLFGIIGDGKTATSNQRKMIMNVWDTQVTTATDVLRFITSLSGGDVSLGKNTKYKNIPRSLRRLILSKLESMNPSNVGEDLMRHRNKWIRVAEKLHPREYSTQFPQTVDCFHALRNEGCKTYNSIIEYFIELGLIDEVLSKCATRPGDFARRLNALINKATNPNKVINEFAKVANSVSTTVLWQLYGYFRGRNELCSYKNRIFLPKKSHAVITIENNLKPLTDDITHRIVRVIIDAIIEKYKDKTEIKGKNVFIDDICQNLLIPSSNRSASSALRQVGRGSRFDLTAPTVRLFMYWQNIGSNRVDLDLSAVTFDADWNYLGNCSWTHLRGSNNAYYHSGDIVDAPTGASEFIDVNLNSLDPNVAYVVCNVNSYTGQKMNQLEVGFMGWMERSSVNSGEIFEPKSVKGRCDLTADATSTSPLIVDIRNNQIIWCDLATTIDGSGFRVENTLPITVATAAKATQMANTSASLYDIFVSNIIAQGADIVYRRSDADYVIAEDGDLSPFDLDRIMTDWV